MSESKKYTNAELKSIKDRIPKDVRKAIKAHLRPVVETAAMEKVNSKGQYERVLQNAIDELVAKMRLDKNLLADWKTKDHDHGIAKKKNIFGKRSASKVKEKNLKVDFENLKKSVSGPDESASSIEKSADPSQPKIVEYDDQDALLDKSLADQDSNTLFKDKMCKIIHDRQSEDAIQGHPGKRIFLNWLIKNESKKQFWPRYPVLRNMTQSEKV